MKWASAITWARSKHPDTKKPAKVRALAGFCFSVGASLLANAAYQALLMLNVSPLSRAGSLPQGKAVTPYAEPSLLRPGKPPR
ncbi:hypothetical protein E1508_10425 [Pseudomonas moraviensis]|nr:hypothetical protein E1508_10425 [Pseudomonas moraviensis]